MKLFYDSTKFRLVCKQKMIFRGLDFSLRILGAAKMTFFPPIENAQMYPHQLRVHYTIQKKSRRIMQIVFFVNDAAVVRKSLTYYHNRFVSQLQLLFFLYSTCSIQNTYYCSTSKYVLLQCTRDVLQRSTKIRFLFLLYYT